MKNRRLLGRKSKNAISNRREAANDEEGNGCGTGTPKILGLARKRGKAASNRSQLETRNSMATLRGLGKNQNQALSTHRTIHAHQNPPAGNVPHLGGVVENQNPQSVDQTDTAFNAADIEEVTGTGSEEATDSLSNDGEVIGAVVAGQIIEDQEQGVEDVDLGSQSVEDATRIAFPEVNGSTATSAHPQPAVGDHQVIPFGDSSLGLVEANLVIEDGAPIDIIEAEEVDPHELQTRQSRADERKQALLRMTFCAIFFLVCSVGTGLGVSIKLGLKEYPQEITAQSWAPSDTPLPHHPSQAPSIARTGVLEVLLQDERLPRSTIEQLQDSSTPQWQAMQWLDAHPDLPGMSEWRKIQLFALACFFYAMEGPHWPEIIQERWLKYEINECLWFSSEFGDFLNDGSYEQGRIWGIDTCDEEGKFRHISLAAKLGLNEFQPALPPEISLLSSLNVLRVQNIDINAPLQDFLPSEIFEMTSLQGLSIGGNHLFGPIPTEFTVLKNMSQLFLGKNKFSGTIPTELETLEKLIVLDLSDNSLTGSIQTELGLLNKMERLMLWGNNLSGSLPTELALMTNLEELGVGLNSLTGPIPTDLALLTQLQTLHLSQNSMSGTLPTELASMSNLSILWLSSNTLTGSIPTQVGQLAHAKWLSLENTALSGPIPSELGLLTTLEEIVLDSNFLSGALPTQLGSMAAMVDFRCQVNQLSGPIPSEFGLWENVQVVALRDNSLTGTIPSEIGFWSNPGHIVLQSNNLSGTIPSQLGLLSSIALLLLHDNALYGPIPSQVGLLSGLEGAWINNNSLTGTVPMQLESLATNGLLRRLRLQDNDLSGVVPEGLCMLGRFNESIGLGLSFDCDNQLCGCGWCMCTTEAGQEVFSSSSGTVTEAVNGTTR